MNLELSPGVHLSWSSFVGILPHKTQFTDVYFWDMMGPILEESIKRKFLYEDDMVNSIIDFGWVQEYGYGNISLVKMPKDAID